jgi:DNA sulfur modification protein DndC
MKIQPTSTYIRQQVTSNGEVILLLGVRRTESAARSKSMNRHRNVGGTRLNPHDDMIGCMVYRPIMELSTDEVWQLLLQRRPPWGGTHRELITLYRNAQGGECPLVIDKSDAPSCGTNSSRFGCWTCTVVDKDHSMEGFIEAGFEHLEPLMDFRDWLAVIRNQRNKRMLERRDGRIALMGDGETTVAGPFTLETRQEILARLLDIQEVVKLPLIHKEEIVHIKRIWAEDTIVDAKRHLRQRELLRERERL